MLALPILFLVTASLYACVGFGGGSTYNALLVLADVDYRVIPPISLLCNIIVVSGGVWHFARAGHINIIKILPWIALSVPAAWLGGYIELPKREFTILLGAALFASGIRMLWPDRKPNLYNGSEKDSKNPEERINRPGLALSLSLGGVLGLIAGLTGIGGGIFLAPVLHLLRWGNPHAIAGTCSLFILLNSLAGLTGKFMRSGASDLMLGMAPYWVLAPAVLLGGQIGSRLGSGKLNAGTVKKMTGILTLYVSFRLLSGI